jgi:hypothetical protein
MRIVPYPKRNQFFIYFENNVPDTPKATSTHKMDLRLYHHDRLVREGNSKNASLWL